MEAIILDLLTLPGDGVITASESPTAYGSRLKLSPHQLPLTPCTGHGKSWAHGSEPRSPSRLCPPSPSGTWVGYTWQASGCSDWASSADHRGEGAARVGGHIWGDGASSGNRKSRKPEIKETGLAKTQSSSDTKNLGKVGSGGILLLEVHSWF